MIGLAVRSVLTQYAIFAGRASRAEYWWYALASFVVSILLDILIGGNKAGEFFLFIFYVVLILPGLAVSVRRLHDAGRSGFWMFITLIPLVGPIVLIVLLAQQGDVGPNTYGAPNPLR